MNKLFNKLNGYLESHAVPTVAVIAVVINLIIEFLGHKNPLKVFVYIGKTPHLFVINCAIVFFTLIFMVLLRRKVFYTLLVSLIWLIFGVINWATLSFRTTPFSARDFSVLASGLQIADVYFTTWEFIGIICAAIALIVIIVLLFIKAPRCEKTGERKTQVLTLVITAVFLVVFGFFGTKNIRLSAQYQSINEAYENCGFAFCFTSSIVKNGIDRPEDYAQNKIDDLGVGGNVDADPDSTPNIIVLQLESFFDPKLIKDVELSEDPIPNFTKLRDTCPSGYLTVPTLGAGTVNAEFEVLTGMSLDYFGIGEYPFESVLREQPCESIAYDLSRLGYSCHAIHNYTGSFYGRNEVYPNLGFDDFTSVEYMQGAEYTEKGWTKDSVLTKYILQAMEQTEGKDLVYTVSVQCHGKYPNDSDNITVDLKGNEVFTGSAAESFKYFVSQLKDTDAFLGELIAALENCGEDVVLVAYGDHLPTLGLSEENLENGTLFQTQYFIWSNCGITNGEDKDLYAYQLASHLFSMIGIDGGVVSSYHREYMGTEGYQEGLEKLEYDLLYGDKYIYNGNVPYERKDMRMGLSEIVIDEISYENEQITLYGEGFTEYSVIYINDNRREDTVFVSENEIYVSNPMDIYGEEDKIEVCQTGPDRKILSTVSP